VKAITQNKNKTISWIGKKEKKIIIMCCDYKTIYKGKKPKRIMNHFYLPCVVKKNNL
jgi:hypothetical protein